MASVTVNLTGYDENVAQVRWLDDVLLPGPFDDFGSDQTLQEVRLNFALADVGQVGIFLTGNNRRFTPEFEATGDGSSLKPVTAKRWK